MTVAVSGETQVDVRRMVRWLRDLAVCALEKMYLPDQRVFVFRIRRVGGRDTTEGISRRYTAVALIGMAGLAQSKVAQVLAGQDIRDVCGGLLDGLSATDDLGEVALTLWASRLLRHPRTVKALSRLRAMRPAELSHPTVEVAWSLAALSARTDSPTDRKLAAEIARRLVASFRPDSGLFAHWPAGAKRAWLRGHVACFADMVYPVAALSWFHLATGDDLAIEAARRCADRLCQLQGAGGQWWWHYDVRTGRVLERYPVYSVHQDSMGPMALLAVQEACGQDHSRAIGRSLAWLECPPEPAGRLLDEQAGVIWRKVARKEPWKLSRKLQAASSRIHPALRAPLIDRVFSPVVVDYESRPYHMGWILHAWPVSSNPPS